MRTHWMSAAILTLAAVCASYAQTAETRAAVVNGKPITMDELNKAAAADLGKLDAKRPATDAAYQQARLKVLHAKLDEMAEDGLIAAEAAKRGDTVARVIEVEIESNIGTPSQEEMADFYEANKAQIPVPLNQAIPQIKEYLMDRERDFYRDMLIHALRKTYGVTVYLDPVRTDVGIAGFPVRGAANAPITIVEFADFECPHCGAMFPVLNRIEKEYGDKVRLVYRQFPLTRIHPHAQKAAEASLCANAQQKFWKFHESLFKKQEDLTVDALKRRAADLKLDTKKFNTCLDSGQQAAAVKKDIDEGDSAGVGGTPTLFVNGRLLSGTTAYTDVRDLIEDELRRIKPTP